MQETVPIDRLASGSVELFDAFRNAVPIADEAQESTSTVDDALAWIATEVEGVPGPLFAEALRLLPESDVSRLVGVDGAGGELAALLTVLQSPDYATVRADLGLLLAENPPADLIQGRYSQESVEPSDRLTACLEFLKKVIAIVVLMVLLDQIGGDLTECANSVDIGFKCVGTLLGAYLAIRKLLKDDTEARRCFEPGDPSAAKQTDPPIIDPPVQTRKSGESGTWDVKVPMDPTRITFMNFSFGDGQSAPTTQVPQGSGYATFSFSHVLYGSTFQATSSDSETSSRSSSDASAAGTYVQTATVVETGASTNSATHVASLVGPPATLADAVAACLRHELLQPLSRACPCEGGVPPGGSDASQDGQAAVGSTAEDHPASTEAVPVSVT